MNQYIVEINNKITHIDLRNVRTLYLPIIGTKAVSLYQALVDESMETFKVDYRYISALIKSLKFNKEDLLSARKTLEAVGLLRTYSSEKKATFLFAILAPLDIKKMQHNKLLFSKLKDAIGDVEVERLVFESNTYTVEKSEYTEISAKYHEIFDVNLPLRVQKTAEIIIPKFENKDEALRSLSAEMFTKFLTNDMASPTLVKTFDTLRNLGFSNRSLNYIQDYSYEVNNKVVAKYLETIAYDLYKSDIMSSFDVEKELHKAKISKKQKIKAISQTTSEIISEGGEMSLDEIFSDLFS